MSGYVYLCYSSEPHSAHKLWAKIIEQKFNGCTISLTQCNIMALFSLCRAKVIVAEGVRPTIVARIIKIWNRNAPNCSMFPMN